MQMYQRKMESVGAFGTNEKFIQMINRQSTIYSRENDIRTEFYRDYTRLLHSTAYRRLKHKTQVFFAPQNDHICTRIEHVTHVESISYTIAKFLGLNTELTQAIAIGHDLGHAPFGHMGERIISEISEKKLGYNFWHEKNGLHFVDDIELLENDKRIKQNLNLTYAVRDGIITHCGEIDVNGLKPRMGAIDLNNINTPGEVSPYTWEGCVVKIADKIAYLGRDIEDAFELKLIDDMQRSAIKEFVSIIRLNPEHKNIKASNLQDVNNTILIHEFTTDICNNSSIDNGIMLSDEKFQIMNKIKEFNYKYVYAYNRINAYKEYANLVINKIYSMLEQCYDGTNTVKKIEELKRFYAILASEFLNWLYLYSDLKFDYNNIKKENKIIYHVNQNKQDYIIAILDFISGMTDQFAIRVFNEIITF